MLVSSSCSTDETVVADSDEEVGVSSIHSIHFIANISSEEAPKGLNTVEISTVHHPPKSEDNHVMSSMDNYCGMTTKKEKVEDPESANSGIIYSQGLIVRDWHLPVTTSSTINDKILNFKRFKKVNSFFSSQPSAFIYLFHVFNDFFESISMHGENYLMQWLKFLACKNKFVGSMYGLFNENAEIWKGRTYLEFHVLLILELYILPACSRAITVAWLIY